MPTTDPLHHARQLPRGARFYKCALQVNPYEYVVRHNHPTTYTSETDYNRALVAVLRKHQIEVIAVTDHYRIESARSLLQAAREAGIVALPGFEAETKEGIHVLCLFDEGRDLEDLERAIGDCGIHDRAAKSPPGDYDLHELLAKAPGWSAACVAAHVGSEKGLLTTLSGQARVRAWTSRSLRACSIPGAIDDQPQDVRQILLNKEPEYRREAPVAILNAQDVSRPEDLERHGSWCWIKMAEVSVEGLRQAFLDPESRVRLASDDVPQEHVELLAMTWEGGFLDQQAVHWSENLNVLIGGRGTGKSTVIESLRYVLDLEPLGKDAQKAHEDIVRQVLRSGTKISLAVQSYRPDQRLFRIERTVPNPPVVRDDDGQVLNLTPQDVVPYVEVYGQHEISELAQSPEKLTRLLDRFVERDPALSRRRGDLRRELKRSRAQLLEMKAEIEQIEERLDALPGLEETLRRFQEAGLEERLRDRSLLVREEQVLRTATERIDPYRGLLEQLRRGLPVDVAFLSERRLAELPGRDLLARFALVLKTLGDTLAVVADRMETAIQQADRELAEQVRDPWEERRRAVQQEYEKTLRELRKASVDGEEFIKLRGRIEELRPLQERRFVLERDLNEMEQHRRNLLAEWADVKAQAFRQLERAGKGVSRKLKNQVKVQVDFEGDREPLFNLLRQIGGRLSEAIDRLRQRESLPLKELADAIREGRRSVERRFDIPPAQADRLVSAEPKIVMGIEELDLPPKMRIELNVGSTGRPEWKRLEDLSKGQKATAVLLLLLLESKAPLIIDQPEDDLDNRFITEGVVPRMREEKRRRQFLFATHNANIPVLGDAELIVSLRAAGEAAEGYAELPAEHMGAMDSKEVRKQVEELLEGGRPAFEMRRLKYGF